MRHTGTQHIAGAALLIALTGVVAPTAAAQGLEAGEELTFSAEARVQIREGNVAAAREEAIETALDGVFAKALQHTAGPSVSSHEYKAIQEAFTRRRGEFLSSFTLRSQIPTDAEYLVALEGSINVRELERELRAEGYLGGVVAPGGQGVAHAVQIAVHGVSSYAEFEALREFLGRDVRGLRDVALRSVKGSVVRFSGSYGGATEGLAGQLNRQGIEGATLQVRGAVEDDVTMFLTR